MRKGLALSAVAQESGTPAYVYSRAHIEGQYRAYTDALAGLPHLVCFAVKANSNLGVLNVLARLGAGFDIVSRGELERVLAAVWRSAPGGVLRGRQDPRRHAPRPGSGRALLQRRIHRRAGTAATGGRGGWVCGRADLAAGQSRRRRRDPPLHLHRPQGKQVRIDIADAEAVYARAAELPNLDILGVDCHIGSQLTTLPPFLDALDRLLALIDASPSAVSSCATWTSVAAWACAIATSSRRWPATTSRPSASASPGAT